MLFLRLTPPALALLLAAGPALPGEPAPLLLEPVPLVSRQATNNINQEIADAIAHQVRSSGQLQGYRIEVAVGAGTAELSGFVGDDDQRAEAARLAHSVPGVNRVVNRLQVGEQDQVTATQYPLAQEALPPPRRLEGPVEPLPSFRAPPTSPVQGVPPFMPPYAWPTYAPYNNYSRVAYPIAYPPEAFPAIGPVHPFPKVPLGWRSVRLEWDDGHWYLRQHAQRHDWWVLRYW